MGVCVWSPAFSSRGRRVDPGTPAALGGLGGGVTHRRPPPLVHTQHCPHQHSPRYSWVALLYLVLLDAGMCWHQPGAQLISENTLWGTCRLWATALLICGGTRFRAQLFTFLSGDESPPCELPLCGESSSCSLRCRSWAPACPWPRSPAVLVLGAV